MLAASALIVVGCAGSGGTIAEPQPTATPVTADALCRAWSKFAGSFQSVGLITVFAGPHSERVSAADGLVDVDVRDEIAAAGITPLSEIGIGDLFRGVWGGGGGGGGVVGLPASVEPSLFTGAVAVFGTQFPPIVKDLSLITDVQTPLTGVYLTSNCSEQGNLAGNEVIRALRAAARSCSAENDSRPGTTSS